MNSPFSTQPTAVQHTAAVPERFDFSDVALPDLPEIPGMIKQEEGQYLYWLASQNHSGRAAVVEIGTWLGRSTLHLAAGLAARGIAAKMICYDHFEWAGGANWGDKAKSARVAGADFLPDFLENTRDYSNFIDVRRAKIAEIDFDSMMIETLVLDAPKRPNDIGRILESLSGRVLPGVTTIAWQDFLHPASFSIPACLSAMWEYHRPVHVVSVGTTVGFRVTSDWQPSAGATDAISFDGWSIDDAERAWARWRGVVPDAECPSFLSGLAMLLHDLGHISNAKALLREQIGDDLCNRRWQKWQKTSLAVRYEELFTALV